MAGALVVQRGPAGGSCLDAHGVFGPVGACLRSTLVFAVGMPAAALIPLIPLAHALRLFGRLERSTDRSWLVFLSGVVVLLPVAVALALGARAENNPLAGLWGNFVSFYVARALGPAGAWILVALAASGLTAATLSWNPVRILVGRGRPAPAGAIAAAA